MVKSALRRFLSVTLAALDLFLRGSMQWYRVVAFPCQFHLFLVEQVSFRFFIPPENAAMANGRFPIRNLLPVNLHLSNELYESLNLRPHPVFLGDRDTLASFFWNSESERVRCLRLHKHQSLVSILHWQPQEAPKETILGQWCPNLNFMLKSPWEPWSPQMPGLP